MFPAFTLTQLLLPPRDHEPRLGVALDAVSHVWIQFLQRPAKRRMRKIKNIILTHTNIHRMKNCIPSNYLHLHEAKWQNM